MHGRYVSACKSLADVTEILQKTEKKTGYPMTDEATQRLRDAEEHKKSYDGIMTAATEVGVPASLGLTMMFTSLVMANGVIFSMLAGVAIYIFSHIIVKLFFSAHH